LPGARHRYIRGDVGWFEMGPDNQRMITVNDTSTIGYTNQYLSSLPSQLMETSASLSRSGFNTGVALYKAAWEGTKYNPFSHNSNYAANTVIYAAGGDVPNGLGFTPGFPSEI
jgi:hypothetical protein